MENVCLPRVVISYNLYKEAAVAVTVTASIYT